MDNDLSRRNRLAIACAAQARAKTEQNVTLLKPLVGRQCGRPTACAEGQRVIFGERAFALHCREHRDIGKFCELLQFGGSVTEQHSSACPDHWSFGVDQKLDGFLDVGP